MERKENIIGTNSSRSCTACRKVWGRKLRESKAGVSDMQMGDLNNGTQCAPFIGTAACIR
jgi:hypothetical protein